MALPLDSTAILGRMEPTIRVFARDLVDERLSCADVDVHFTKALVRHVLESYSEPGDLVLDPFVGFGTTLEVCADMGRRGIGIELLADRAELARRRAGVTGQVIHGDARQIRSSGIAAVDLCFTSPPYMNAVDHPQNPLTGYTTLDGDYDTYLRELTEVFIGVRDALRPGGHLVVNAANIRTRRVVTPLAWDIARSLAPHMTFIGETYLAWDAQPAMLSGDYCLTFQR